MPGVGSNPPLSANRYKGMFWFRQEYRPNNKRAVVGYTTLKRPKTINAENNNFAYAAA